MGYQRRTFGHNSCYTFKAALQFDVFSIYTGDNSGRSTRFLYGTPQRTSTEFWIIYKRIKYTSRVEKGEHYSFN